MKIEVTQEDIDKGLPKNPCRCPVALAITRATGFDAGYIDVDGHEMMIGDAIVPTPTVASAFISKFDHCGKVAPFTFELDLTE